VAGQVDDLLADDLPAEQVELERIHRRKTGRLLASACRLGALAVGANENQLEHLTKYGLALGLAFQIADDVLDARADPLKAGKNLGRDAQNNKTTTLTLWGEEKATAQAKALAEQAAREADALPGNQKILGGLAHFAASRLY